MTDTNDPMDFFSVGDGDLDGVVPMSIDELPASVDNKDDDLIAFDLREGLLDIDWTFDVNGVNNLMGDEQHDDFLHFTDHSSDVSSPTASSASKYDYDHAAEEELSKRQKAAQARKDAKERMMKRKRQSPSSSTSKAETKLPADLGDVKLEKGLTEDQKRDFDSRLDELQRKEEMLCSIDSNDMSKEAKKQRRLIRNRLSAQLHRERKKAYVDELESKLQMANERIAQLEKQVERLESENTSLKLARNGSEYSSSPPYSPATSIESPPASPDVLSHRKRGVRKGSKRMKIAQGVSVLMGVCMLVALLGSFDNPSDRLDGTASSSLVPISRSYNFAVNQHTGSRALQPVVVDKYSKAISPYKANAIQTEQGQAPRRMLRSGHVSRALDVYRDKSLTTKDMFSRWAAQYSTAHNSFLFCPHGMGHLSGIALSETSESKKPTVVNTASDPENETSNVVAVPSRKWLFDDTMHDEELDQASEKHEDDQTVIILPLSSVHFLDGSDDNGTESQGSDGDWLEISCKLLHARRIPALKDPAFSSRATV